MSTGDLRARMHKDDSFRALSFRGRIQRGNESPNKMTVSAMHSIKQVCDSE